MQMARENEDPVRLMGPMDPSLLTLEGPNLVGFDNRFNSSQVRNELGWRPRIPYADAMARIARQWTQMKQTSWLLGPRTKQNRRTNLYGRGCRSPNAKNKTGT